MFRILISVLLLLCSSIVEAGSLPIPAPPPGCLERPLAQYAGLAQHHGFLSWCEKKYPVPVVTSTKTIPITKINKVTVRSTTFVAKTSTVDVTVTVAKATTYTCTKTKYVTVTSTTTIKPSTTTFSFVPPLTLKESATTKKAKRWIPSFGQDPKHGHHQFDAVKVCKCIQPVETVTATAYKTHFINKTVTVPYTKTKTKVVSKTCTETITKSVETETTKTCTITATVTNKW